MRIPVQATRVRWVASETEVYVLLHSVNQDLSTEKIKALRFLNKFRKPAFPFLKGFFSLSLSRALSHSHTHTHNSYCRSCCKKMKRCILDQVLTSGSSSEGKLASMRCKHSSMEREVSSLTPDNWKKSKWVWGNCLIKIISHCYLSRSSYDAHAALLWNVERLQGQQQHWIANLLFKQS